MSAALIVFVKPALPCFASELFVIKHRVSSCRKQHRKFMTCILQVDTDFSGQCKNNKLIKAMSPDDQWHSFKKAIIILLNQEIYF